MIPLESLQSLRICSYGAIIKNTRASESDESLKSNVTSAPIDIHVNQQRAPRPLFIKDSLLLNTENVKLAFWGFSFLTTVVINKPFVLYVSRSVLHRG